MFSVGDYIVHGRNGVCKVEDITHIDVSGADKNKLYYQLVPMKSEDSKIFYPVDSDKVVMRAILSKSEVENLLEGIKDIEPVYIENDRQREAVYKEAIASCDCRKLIEIIKTLHIRERERMAEGKRMTFIDDKYLKEAKNNLHEEFSIALGMEKILMEDYIKKYI